MTGFGRAEAKLPGFRLRVEINSVNNKKGLDVLINLPREFASAENRVREQVEKKIDRGRVSLQAVLDRSAAAKKDGLQVDRQRLISAHRELKSLARETGCPENISLEFLLRLPGVMSDTAAPAVGPEDEGVLLKTVETALAEFMAFREREGSFLAKDLIAVFQRLEITVKKIEKLRPKMVRQYRDNLRKRIAEAGVDLPLNDERLQKELVLFADRSDVTEEIKRLEAHFAEARRILKVKKPGGRTLDFLLQEIGREVNTIGSKANALEVSQAVIDLKTELEKIREQVQNLE